MAHIIPGKHKRNRLLFLFIALFLGAYLANYSGLVNYFITQQQIRTTRIEWKDMGSTPEGNRRFTPQGLTWLENHLIFANSWKDTLSRIYKIDPGTMQVVSLFDMPDEAGHTSGLAWDGRYLWAVDYISNRAYKIELKSSFLSGKAEILGSFDTTLKGTSACCIVEYNGEKLLCISDFMQSRKNVLVRQDDALNKGTATGNIVQTYKNEGFSQGLAFDGQYVYESENKIGINVVNKYTIDDAISVGSSKEATITQYNAPSKGVEDLAWDGEYFWTSDETTFRFYKTKLLNNEF